MEPFIKRLAIVTTFLLGACTEGVDVPPGYADSVAPEEMKIIGQWSYKYILVNDVRYDLADRFLTPAPDGSKRLAGGERAILTRRGIFYSQEHTYQLRWNRSEYQLGTQGQPNWQPNYGLWILEGDSLVHNENYGTHVDYNRIAYKIEFSGNSMTRTSNRYMSDTFDSLRWKAGDIVVFKEVFERP